MPLKYLSVFTFIVWTSTDMNESSVKVTQLIVKICYAVNLIAIQQAEEPIEEKSKSKK